MGYFSKFWGIPSMSPPVLHILVTFSHVDHKLLHLPVGTDCNLCVAMRATGSLIMRTIKCRIQEKYLIFSFRFDSSKEHPVG